MILLVIHPELGALAAALAYPAPGGEYPSAVHEAVTLLERSNPAAAQRLRAFEEHIAALSPTEREELFTRTFDVNPVCCLEIGWQLYGDNYDRGAFLVQMRERLRALGVEESSELPDHLTHVLSALARMETPVAAEFAQRYVLHAVDKMLAGLEGKQSPYEHVLRAVRAALANLIASV